MPNESDLRPNLHPSVHPDGLHQDPDGVISLPGWKDHVGKANACTWTDIVTEVAGKGVIDWTLFRIARLTLSQTAGLLVLQGLPLGQLFQGAVFSTPNFEASGAFILLKGDLEREYIPGRAITGLVLGRLRRYPAGVSDEEILGAMLQPVLNLP